MGFTGFKKKFFGDYFGMIDCFAELRKPRNSRNEKTAGSLAVKENFPMIRRELPPAMVRVPQIAGQAYRPLKSLYTGIHPFFMIITPESAKTAFTRSVTPA
jgi:hypothetical protein